MSKKKYLCWKDEDMWIGYLRRYPNYQTQGKTEEELRENMVDVYGTLTSGDIEMSFATSFRYVVRNPDALSREPIIIGTRTSVRAIVGLWQFGITPEDILNHLPHLTFPQVLDALSFYLDNQDEIDGHIERNQVPDDLVHPSVKAVLKNL